MVEYEIVRLSADCCIDGFDCGNSDINGFLAEDARDYQEGLMAVTYLAMCDKDLVAYFCLLNDKLAYLPGDDRKDWNRLNRKVQNRKRMKSYPAVKIGRLGTSTKYARQGVARELIDLVKLRFSDNNRTGCRFLTVDAHREAIGLYEKCGFSFFTEKDKDDETRLMYFDLKHFRDAMHDTVNA